jgi:hypothetical protein
MSSQRRRVLSPRGPLPGATRLVWCRCDGLRGRLIYRRLSGARIVNEGRIYRRLCSDGVVSSGALACGFGGCCFLCCFWSWLRSNGGVCGGFCRSSGRGVGAGGDLEGARGENAFFDEQLAGAVAGTCAAAEPELHAVRIDAHHRRIGQRVIEADRLDESAVAWAARIRNHQPVHRAFGGAHSLQPDLYQCRAPFKNLLVRVGLDRCS